MHGTGGGRGQDLASHEQVALDCMSSRGSHLITGIEGGFETSLSRKDSANNIILAEDTQPPILYRDNTGKFVDDEGNTVDLTKYGVSLEGVTSVPETQFNIDEDTLDDIPCTEDDAASLVPTQATVSCNITQPTGQEVPSTSTNDVIEITSGESTVKKRKLMSKETESDFFEDHLIELLDAGNSNAIFDA